MDFKDWKSKKDETEAEKRSRMLFYILLLCITVVVVTLNGLLYLFLCWCGTPYEAATNYFCDDRPYTMTLSPFSHPYVVFSLISFNLLVGAVLGLLKLLED
jgi:hypothetical protein